MLTPCGNVPSSTLLTVFSCTTDGSRLPIIACVGIVDAPLIIRNRDDTMYNHEALVLCFRNTSFRTTYYTEDDKRTRLSRGMVNNPLSLTSNWD